MKKIQSVIMITLIIWTLTSIIGGSFNPMEWNWVWRVIAVIWYLLALKSTMED
jgi:hypothetical protein